MVEKKESEERPRGLAGLTIGVGTAQLYAWGVIYYPFSVTGKLIAADVGLSIETAFLGYSLLLVAGALAAPWVGRAIDRRGGRRVLAAGCLIAAVALVGAAYASGPWTFMASCIGLGIASALTLYDAGFAGLVQVAGAQGRRAITYVTFLGGFASTVFWPITAWLCGLWGWRAAYLIYAAGMVLICLPIYLATMGRPAAPAAGETSAAASAQEERPLRGPARRSAFIALAVAIAAHQLVIAGLSIHLIGAMQQAGLTAEQAIVVGMAFGPGQVAGRIGEMIFGGRFSAMAGARVSVAILPLALLFLLSGSMSFAFAILFALGCGVSNGLMTIARGAVSLALFGREGYGAVIGDLALATLVSRAVGPLALAFGLAQFGLPASALFCIGFALAGVAAMEVTARIGARARQAESAPAA